VYISPQTKVFGSTHDRIIRAIAWTGMVGPVIFYSLTMAWPMAIAWTIAAASSYYGIFYVKMSRKQSRLMMFMACAIIAIAHLAYAALPANAVLVEALSTGIGNAVGLITGAQQLGNALTGLIQLLFYIVFAIMAVYMISKKNSDDEEKSRALNRLASIFVYGFIIDQTLTFFGLGV
jgi:hypothetical protein